jgi:putative ABC transport system substrate-binding protein
MTTVSRRRFVQAGGVAGLGLLAGCAIPRAPWQPVKLPRVAFLSASTPVANATRLAAFRTSLRELGYLEGDNILLEYWYGEGQLDHMSELAAELVRLNVDVIVTAAPAPTRAVQATTAAIPVVMAYDPDPVGNGFVTSVARPGGNITGLSSLAPGISGKQLQLLAELVPALSQVAVLGTSVLPELALDPRSKEVERTARVLGVQVRYAHVRDPAEMEIAFREARREQADAVIVFASPILEADRPRVVDLAAQSRLPTIYPVPEFVEAGGLLSYGVSFVDLYRRAAIYVDKILKGASPAELPVEQPMRFDFVINLKTANALGLTIPPHVLLQATEVIQ